MTYEQYWYGDVTMIYQFREAERLRIKRQNEFAHLQGLYFNDALYTNLANFFRGKGKPATAKYPEEPYDILGEKKTAEYIEQDNEKERQRAYDYFDAIIKESKRRKAERERKSDPPTLPSV